ncbi:MAG: family 10 glycosylhydrolase [Clostridiales bacterium]|nr:family 10 glycosylhydrolase [Clostridiales bacterium]
MAFFVGLPTSAEDFYAMGTEKLLDYLKDTARVNAVIIAARTFHGEAGYETHDKYFAGTKLRDTPSALKQSGFDILAEITDRAHERGMKVYSHFLSYDFAVPAADSETNITLDENGWEVLPNAKLLNLSQVLEIDCFGRKGMRPCLNNPDYRQYHLSVVEDQLRSYAIDGINFNIERYGPISNVLNGNGGSAHGRKPLAATCFCPHCLESAHKRGIDLNRAKLGFLALLEFSERSWQAALKDGNPMAAPGTPLCANRDTSAPPDGYFIEFMRILGRYPEIAAWNQMWHDNMLSLLAEVHGTAKAVSPGRKVGFHVWHPRDYSPMERAMYNMRDMRRFCDWIKPKMDHTCGGYRYYQNIKRIHQSLFYDRTLQQAASVMNAIFDWDVADYERLPENGLGLDYLEKDTKAYIADVFGEVPIYPGIGLDMPSGPAGSMHRPCEPEYVRDGLLTIAKAGAQGTVLSRGFGEMQRKNLAMAGKTIDEINSMLCVGEKYDS